jgi:hypothetical protein
MYAEDSIILARGLVDMGSKGSRGAEENNN